MNDFLLSYLTDYLKFKTADIIYLLDFKKFYRGLIITNWLTLDLPFSLNPYLVTNFDKSALQFNDTNSLVYKLNFFNFSKFNTLKETINFNLFYDWSNGAYLDTINFISYISTSRGSGMLNNIFFDNPAYIAATFL
ncbi:hypothetical protein KA001_00155 [Patescibacteria group bacterium]|nr:hypothetical protein [Patescibacteria group bacterium]